MSNMKIEDIMRAPLEQLGEALAIMQGFLPDPDGTEESVCKAIRDRPVGLCRGENYPAAPYNRLVASNLAVARQVADARQKEVVVVAPKDDHSATTARRWPARRPLQGALALWQQRRVAAYIRDHIGARLRLSELAGILHLSESHFIRTFKASFGESPIRYITRQRVLYAQVIMLSTATSLSEVALACGWCDQPHFTRAFHRIVQLSPGAWRRRHGLASMRAMCPPGRPGT